VYTDKTICVLTSEIQQAFKNSRVDV
jgi:hypothetical protein